MQSRSVTPSPNLNQRQTAERPQALAVQRTRAITFQSAPPNPNVLHPLGKSRNSMLSILIPIYIYTIHVFQFSVGAHTKNQLKPGSRQASSNASDGGINRESSLDDSGVVDDHEDQDINLSTIEVYFWHPSFRYCVIIIHENVNVSLHGRIQSFINDLIFLY